jgi:hypothetical protein
MATKPTVGVSLVTPQDLLPALSNTPLGDSSLSLQLASAKVTMPVHLASSIPVEFTFEAGADFWVVALNGKCGPDAHGVVAATGANTPDGAFTPLLRLTSSDAWLKYVCDANVKASVGADVGAVRFTGGAGATVTLVDYRHHTSDSKLLSAATADLLGQRVAVIRDHVAGLTPGDAVAFETRGELTAAVDIEWCDVFTSEIGRLARLLKTAAPIALSFQTGATCSVKVGVTDTFLVVFARDVDGGPLRVGIAKAAVKDLDVNAGVSIAAQIASGNPIEQVLDDVVAGLLGTVKDRLAALLDHAGTGTMTAADNQLAPTIVDRLKLAGVSAIQSGVAALKQAAFDEIKAIVETKVKVAFAYEYHRVDATTTVFECTIPGPLTDELHGALIGGNIDLAFSQPAAVVVVTRYLNDRKTTTTHAWGFTLGLAKWSIFGRDRRQIERVTRYDALKKTVWRSYIGSGGYERTNLTWAADFKADATAFSAQPLVRDYDLGLHLAWTRDKQTFEDGDLERALDFAALWSICPESSLSVVRQFLADAVNQTAEWSFHIRVNDEALRPIARVVGSMTPRDFAPAAAAGMDPADGTQLVSVRRKTYAPLWQAVLQAQTECNATSAAAYADQTLGATALAMLERETAEHGMFNASTVAGLVGFNDTFADAQRFIQGCRLLADAIANGSPDTSAFDDVYRALVAFWTESHYVRTLGALLVDVARSVGQLEGVERTLCVGWGTTTLVVSSNDFASA